MKKATCMLLVVAVGCSSNADADPDPLVAPMNLGGSSGPSNLDGGSTASAMVTDECRRLEGMCDDLSGRALGCGPYVCAQTPSYFTVTGTTDDRAHTFDIFTYEASHPLATATDAYPCADTHQAAAERTQACSQGAVIPWHSVLYTDAEAACTAIDWRLCTREEMLSACQGPSRFAYPYGSNFDAGACNVNSVRGEIAPTGDFTGCQSLGGGYDLTGNLWEWTSHRDPSDPRSRYYQGAGWKIVAERHQATELRCETDSRLPAFTASSFAASHVGFRCCRDAK
ncbi:MAG: SUMF1/EgtB/PvdO family nonheme iron enzyme [Myxococcota bacterium]|nr:SUMF1/EgtB/PvdO family nonheme iron enzyme [Myxococcota bacterium]